MNQIRFDSDSTYNETVTCNADLATVCKYKQKTTTTRFYFGVIQFS